MAIPLFNAADLNKRDLVYQEKDPDTIDVQFMESAPITKLLYKFTPEELGVIYKISYSVGPNDNSVNGYAYLMLTRILNPSFYTTDYGQNQVMFRKVCGEKFVEGYEPFDKDPLYLRVHEPFYLYLATNYPSPVKVYGHLTLYTLPTSR